MTRRAIALAAGTFLTLSGFAASALAEPPAKPVHEINVDANGLIRVHEQGTVSSQVVNFPLDAQGNLKTAATQSGPWSVGLDTAASSSLSNIDTATSGLHYDADGNLKVSVAPTGSAADPSVADRSPFGFQQAATIPAADSLTINAGAPVNVTSYFVHAVEGTIAAIFMESENHRFAFLVEAGQSVTGSVAHAIRADTWQLQCAPGNNCIVFYSAAGY
jgi:hypothetical protein